MAHPNDTLNGKLLEHELEEEKHLRSKMGYWRMVEERMVCKELIAEGHDPKEMGFYFKIKQRVVENHRNDPTLRQQQEAARGGSAAPILSAAYFTVFELRHLIEHFAMANDPVAQEIDRKARVALRALGEEA
jgi:hypothetical protein